MPFSRPAPTDPWLPLLRATDAAEASGDAATALRLATDRPLEPDGRLFWRPWRLRRLSQLTELGGLVPGWGHCRWVLAQALQDLDAEQGRSGLRGLEVTLDVLGRPGEHEPAAGDETQRRLQVLDHDWVFRQVHLYELGGLTRFVRRVAGPRLLERADRVEEWTVAPMGGYRLLAATSRVLVWTELAGGSPVRTPNLGAASLVGEGECVLGRLVPCEEPGSGASVMFESAPLLVPPETAALVARAPEEWLDALREACRGPWGSGIRLLSTWVQDHGLLGDAPRLDWPVIASADDLAAWPRRRWEAHEWGALANAVLEPGVPSLLRETLRPHHAEPLRRLARRVAGPASRICHLLAGQAPRRV